MTQGLCQFACITETVSSNISQTIEEALFDWIEVWEVWWQEKKDATKALNEFLKHMHLVHYVVIKNQYALIPRIQIHT